VTYLASKAIDFGDKCKIRAITPFKVIQGHRGQYQEKHSLCIFEPPLSAEQLRLTGKAVVDFVFVLIELFLLGVTDKALRVILS